MILGIVIPYYKKTFFRETLQSLADQTDKRFKVYIGNDASPENPDDLILEFQDKLDFEYHKFEENLGGISLVKQWERCIDLVQNEEWITILGDDDVYGNNVVEEFYNQYDKFITESNVVRYATIKIDGQGCYTSLEYKHPSIEKSTDFIFRKSRSSLSEYVFKRSILFEVGFVDLPLAWFSDLLAVLEVSKFSSIYTINNALLKIRVSEYSISGSNNNSVLKTNASFGFYSYLLKNYSNCFTVVQLSDLENSWQNVYFNNKRNIFFLSNIFIYYVRNIRVFDLSLFLLNSIKSILRPKSLK